MSSIAHHLPFRGTITEKRLGEHGALHPSHPLQPLHTLHPPHPTAPDAPDAPGAPEPQYGARVMNDGYQRLHATAVYMSVRNVRPLSVSVRILLHVMRCTCTVHTI